jgi:hypothetical protein
MKSLITFLTFIFIAGCALFWREVWGIFAGKSPLEALDMIGQFLLHVGMLTIVGFLVTTIPAFIKPWLKVARLNGRRRLKSVRRQPQQVEARMAMPKMNKNQMIEWLVSQQVLKSNPSPRSPQTKGTFGERANADENQLRF